MGRRRFWKSGGECGFGDLIVGEGAGYVGLRGLGERACGREMGSG